MPLSLSWKIIDRGDRYPNILFVVFLSTFESLIKSTSCHRKKSFLLAAVLRFTCKLLQ